MGSVDLSSRPLWKGCVVTDLAPTRGERRVLLLALDEFIEATADHEADKRQEAVAHPDVLSEAQWLADDLATARDLYDRISKDGAS